MAFGRRLNGYDHLLDAIGFGRIARSDLDDVLL